MLLSLLLGHTNVINPWSFISGFTTLSEMDGNGALTKQNHSNLFKHTAQSASRIAIEWPAKHGDISSTNDWHLGYKMGYPPETFYGEHVFFLIMGFWGKLFSEPHGSHQSPVFSCFGGWSRLNQWPGTCWMMIQQESAMGIHVYFWCHEVGLVLLSPAILCMVICYPYYIYIYSIYIYLHLYPIVVG